MDCKALNERMLDYFDGALDERTRHEVEAHLESCLACREEVESLREISARLDQLPADAPSSTARVRFEEMLRAYESGRETPSAIPRNLRRGILRVAAAVALVILGGLAGYGMKSLEPSIATRTDGLTRYILTVYEVREQTDRIPEEQMRAAGKRYRAWERDLTEHGQLLDVALLFLGLPLILARGNHNMYLAAGVGLAVVAGFFLLVIACHWMGRGNLLSPALAAWLPALAMVPVAVSFSEPLRQ